MKREALYAARGCLGYCWGKGRRLFASELGRALRMGGRDPGLSILNYEAGRTKIPGPVSVAVEMFMAGAPPPGGVP